MSERLFEAIGGADPHLVARSEKRAGSHWKAGFFAAAACFALLAAAMYFRTKPVQGEIVPPPDEPQPSGPVLELKGGEVGELHLLSSGDLPDFLIYVNQEMFSVQETEDAYSIRPLVSFPPDNVEFPFCGMDIVHADRSPEETKAAAETAALADIYTEIDQEAENHVLENALYFRAGSGNAWDSDQLECYFVSDGQGGTFVLVSRYYLEAEEGFGVRFRDMAGTFQVITGEERVPDWMQSLRAAAGRLYPALLADDTESVSDLLAEDAEIDLYGEDVWPDVTVASVDYAPDSDRDPSRCTVWVKHRTGGEEPYDYLTMELMFQDGQWLLYWAGLEK